MSGKHFFIPFIVDKLSEALNGFEKIIIDKKLLEFLLEQVICNIAFHRSFTEKLNRKM